MRSATFVRFPPPAKLRQWRAWGHPGTPMYMAAPHRACWTDMTDVNLGNTVWPPGDARCAYRHATLRRAQLACESAVLTP
eukprot:scaffold60257_cov46-Phaeocystis_antarctica.AAC.2